MRSQNGELTVDLTIRNYVEPSGSVRYCYVTADGKQSPNLEVLRDQWNNYVPDPYQLNYAAMGATSDEYCNICNSFQYDTSIMADATVRTAHIKDTTDLYNDIQFGTLPAVSFVKPSGLVDGHPASSKLNLFEGFMEKIVDGVKANPELWNETAIFITFDEGGGY